MSEIDLIFMVFKGDRTPEPCFENDGIWAFALQKQDCHGWEQLKQKLATIPAGGITVEQRAAHLMLLPFPANAV